MNFNVVYIRNSIVNTYTIALVLQTALFEARETKLPAQFPLFTLPSMLAWLLMKNPYGLT